jgi:polar amino acid transport system substrate-binding protein
MIKFAYLIEAPFNYRSADGAVTGCDVELARTALGMVGIHDFEMVETEFARLLPGLAEGRWRMTTGLFATEERRRIAAFSRPIWALPDGLLVRNGNPMRLSGYRSAARTDGCVLAVIRDQIQHRSAVDFGLPGDRLLIFETYADAAQAVVEGQADAYASVARAHSGFIERHPSLKILALAFLILIGVVLVADGLGQHLPKGYVYCSMAFSLGVELLNMRFRRRTRRR